MQHVRGRLRVARNESEVKNSSCDLTVMKRLLAAMPAEDLFGGIRE